jgi:hypothetical protein
MGTIRRAVVVAQIASLLLCGFMGCGQKEERAQSVWLYEYRGLPQRGFSDVTIYERRTGYIKFRVGDQIIEHSGRYTIQNTVQ